MTKRNPHRGTKAPAKATPEAPAPSAQTAPQPGAPETGGPQPELRELLGTISGENAFLRQQVGQLYQVVRQLYDAVAAQCRQIDATDKGVQAELKRLQSTTAQQAMGGIFKRMLTDLLVHMNQLDELVGLMQVAIEGEAAASWLEAFSVARDGMQKTLKDWGCHPMSITPNETEFDPQVHESVTAREGEIPDDCPEHCIARVRRRGWTMGGEILQFPQVVVA